MKQKYILRWWKGKKQTTISYIINLKINISFFDPTEGVERSKGRQLFASIGKNE